MVSVVQTRVVAWPVKGIFAAVTRTSKILVVRKLIFKNPFVIFTRCLCVFAHGVLFSNGLGFSSRLFYFILFHFILV